MAQLRVLLGFAAASDHVLEETAGHVLNGFYGTAVPTFPAPPVVKTQMQGALTAFTAAIAAQAQGGPAATAAKDVARDNLVRMLRQDAGYVQGVVQLLPADQGMAALLSSGFEAVSNSHAQHPLDTPGLAGIDNDGAGRLRLRITPVRNARTYEVRERSGTGDWVSAGLYQSTRKLVVAGLTAGTTYTFQVRAVGGSTGASEWSDPFSHMSL